jgi:hypothetical protein
METKNQNPAMETTNTTELTTVKTSVIVQDAISLEQIFDEAENLHFKEETREYLSVDKMNENEPRIFIYEGLSEITIPETGEVKNAVLLRDKSGTAFITSAKVIVNALSRLTAPEIVKVVYMGKKGTGNSKYADFKVFTPIR